MTKSLTTRVETATRQITSAGKVFSDVKCADKHTMIDTGCGDVPSLRKMLGDLEYTGKAGVDTILENLGSVVYRGNWSPRTDYKERDLIKDDDHVVWFCLSDHQSSAEFDTDVGSGRWVPWQNIYAYETKRQITCSTIEEAKAIIYKFVHRVIITDRADAPFEQIDADRAATYPESAKFQDAGGQWWGISTAHGRLQLRWFGAVGDGYTDDKQAFLDIVDFAPSGVAIVFDPGHTFLLSAGYKYANDARRNPKLTRAKSFHFIAHGAKIRLKDFTGSELIHIEHIPEETYTDNAFLFDAWDFLWEGGEIDANGYNQNFKWANNIRDGIPNPVADWEQRFPQSTMADAEAQARKSALVFGPQGRFPINPKSTGVESKYPIELIRVRCARTVTFRDVIVRNRHEEGLCGFCCDTMNVTNCHDYNSLPTNDQWVIYYLAGGGLNGQQHFAVRTSYTKTRGILKVNPVAGKTFPTLDIVREKSDLQWKAYVWDRIGDNTYRLWDVYDGDGFVPGQEITLRDGGNVIATVEHFELISAPSLNVTDCSAIVGNSGIGYMDVNQCALYSALNVNNYTVQDMGTIGIRAEHVHYENLRGVTCINSNINTDPTKTLGYFTQQGIEIGAHVHTVNANNIQVINSNISGSIQGLQQKQYFNNIDVEILDTDPVMDARTLKSIKVPYGICGWGGKITNVHVRSKELIKEPGQYPIETGILANDGWVSDFTVTGARIGVQHAERLTNGEIRNISDYATWGSYGATGNPIRYKNLYVYNCRVGLIVGVPHPNPDAYIVIDGCEIEKIQSNAISAPYTHPMSLDVRNCLIKDWGLNTTYDNFDRAAIGASGQGARPQRAYLFNNRFHLSDPNCYTRVYECATGELQEFIEQGTVISPVEKADTVAMWASAPKLRIQYPSIVHKDRGATTQFQSVSNSSGEIGRIWVADKFNYLIAGNTHLKMPSISINAGDTLTFRYMCPPVHYHQNRTLFAGTGPMYCTVGAGNIAILSNHFSLKIDGKSIAHKSAFPLDNGEHLAEVTFSKSTTLIMMGASSSGQEQLLDGYIHSVVVRSADKTHTYGIDVISNVIEDATGGMDGEIINYLSNNWRPRP